jgi:hypothetical protein
MYTIYCILLTTYCTHPHTLTHLAGALPGCLCIVCIVHFVHCILYNIIHCIMHAAYRIPLILHTPHTHSHPHTHTHTHSHTHTHTHTLTHTPTHTHPHTLTWQVRYLGAFVWAMPFCSCITIIYTIIHNYTAYTHLRRLLFYRCVTWVPLCGPCPAERRRSD